MTRDETDAALEALARVVDGRDLTTTERAALRSMLRDAPTLVRVAKWWRYGETTARVAMWALGFIGAVLAFAAAVKGYLK